MGVQPAATGEFLPVGGCWLIGHSSQWVFVLLTRDRLVCVSRSVVSDSLRPHGLQPARLLCPWDSSGKITGIGCHTLLQGIFPTQGSNPAFPHCRRILYRLSPQESPGCAEAEFIQCLPRDPANAPTGPCKRSHRLVRSAASCWLHCPGRGPSGSVSTSPNQAAAAPTSRLAEGRPWKTLVKVADATGCSSEHLSLPRKKK